MKKRLILNLVIYLVILLIILVVYISDARQVHGTPAEETTSTTNPILEALPDDLVTLLQDDTFVQVFSFLCSFISVFIITFIQYRKKKKMSPPTDENTNKVIEDQQTKPEEPEIVLHDIKYKCPGCSYSEVRTIKLPKKNQSVDVVCPRCKGIVVLRW